MFFGVFGIDVEGAVEPEHLALFGGELGNEFGGEAFFEVEAMVICFGRTKEPVVHEAALIGLVDPRGVVNAGTAYEHLVGVKFERDFVGQFDIGYGLACFGIVVTVLFAQICNLLGKGFYRADVAAGYDTEAAIFFCRAREVVHELDIFPLGISMPKERAVWGEFVNATVAIVDVGVVFELSNQFDNFGMEFYLEKREGMVEFAPIRIGHLGA